MAFDAKDSRPSVRLDGSGGRGHAQQGQNGGQRYFGALTGLLCEALFADDISESLARDVEGAAA
jgi:hypothetical protein